ncbi:MAG: hypothetical protein ACLR53_05080 [Evtepia gabavorous]
MKRVQQKVHSAFSPRRQRMFLIAAGIALQFAIYVVLLVLFPSISSTSTGSACWSAW